MLQHAEEGIVLAILPTVSNVPPTHDFVDQQASAPLAENKNTCPDEPETHHPAHSKFQFIATLLSLFVSPPRAYTQHNLTNNHKSSVSS